MAFLTLTSGWPLLVGLDCLSGLLSGLLGIGGGIVIVPALVWMLPVVGVDGEALPRVAIATSVATIIPTAIASAQQHGARGAIEWTSFALLAPGIVSGAFIAGYFAERIDVRLLCVLFVFYAAYTAHGMVQRDTVRIEYPARADARPTIVWMTLVGLSGGALSSLIGLGSDCGGSSGSRAEWKGRFSSEMR